MKNQFFMILPSNGSMKVYQDNTTACFTTKLPQEINLRGSWEVGISEIHFPKSFLHVREDESELTVRNDYFTFIGKEEIEKFKESKFYDVSIPHGIYPGIKEFINQLNNNLKDYHMEFRFSSEYNNTFVEARLTCTLQGCLLRHHLEMSRTILDILGFTEKSGYIRIEYEPLVATRPASLLNGMPRQLYVYTDICEPTIVGDVQASLLRIVPVNYEKSSYASVQCTGFAPINYMPLIRNSFRTITIDIRDHLGKPAPFESGTSLVQLHFRKSTDY